MKKIILSIVLGSSLVLSACSQDDTENARGISDDEIRVGTHTDLSGVLASWGVPANNGLMMRIEEANAAGGVHGRKIKLFIEDTSYQVPKTVRAVNKLIEKEDVFAMVMGVGTPHNLAVMPKLDELNIPNLFPLSGAASMVEPLHPLHFNTLVSYQDQMIGAVKYAHKTQNVQNICIQSAANDAGEEISAGVLSAAQELGLTVVYQGAHKVTETDFAGTATKIKNAGCDALFLGSFVNDTITLYTTLRKLGWQGPAYASLVPYMPLVAAANNGAMEGLYVSTPMVIANFEDGDAWREAFYKKYVERYGADPALQAQIGYVAADLFIASLEKAGRDVNVETFLKALESIKEYQPAFGGPKMSFSATKHVGGDYLVLEQVQNGKWVTLVDNLPF